MKKILLTALSLTAILALAVSGTYAYQIFLAETEPQLRIEQTVYERRGDKLEEKAGAAETPVVPAVYETIGEKTSQTWAQTGEIALYGDDIRNVVDHIVTVRNTGEAAAFIRTVVAIECPEGMDGLLHINDNRVIRTPEPVAMEMDGVRYVMYEYVYTDALAPNKVSPASFLQVFFDKEATNADMERLGETWEIRAVSQAVAADAFDGARRAFPMLTADKHPFLQQSN